MQFGLILKADQVGGILHDRLLADWPLSIDTVGFGDATSGRRTRRFKNQIETVALRSSEVLVKEAGVVGDMARFKYEIRADDMGVAKTDAERRAAILRVIEPISGEVRIEKYNEVKDASGHTVAYEAWVLR